MFKEIQARNAELHEALEHGQTGTPNTENPNIFLDLDYVATDADGDGSISFEEFMEWWTD